MALVLTIEAGERVGTRRSVRLEDDGHLDIGRGAGLDWTLPDPARIISAKHCEIRFRGGKYWLYDVSRNGTFLNQAVRRLRGPHPLSHGDRFAIGSYVIAVTIEGDAVASPADTGRGFGVPLRENRGQQDDRARKRSVAPSGRSRWR